MTWSKKPWMQSAGPPRPDVSATEKFLFPPSRKPSGSERGNPDWTPSEPSRAETYGPLEEGTRSNDDRKRCPEDDQGQRRQIRRLSLHRSARQVAARDVRHQHDRRRHLRRRHHV